MEQQPQQTQESLQQPPLQKLNKHANLLRWLPVVLFLAAAIGFADAAFLSIEHYLGRTPPCNLVSGCELVTTSKYSEILGVPVAYLGAAYYLSMLVLVIAWFDKKKEIFLRLASIASIPGLLASIWFVSLQLFVIHAICVYCMGSATSSTLLFILGMTYLAKSKQHAH